MIQTPLIRLPHGTPEASSRIEMTMLWKVKARFFWLWILPGMLVCMIASSSCKKENIIPSVVVKPSVSYFTIDMNQGNQVLIDRKDTYHYELKTTGDDPYLFLTPLTTALHPDSLVLMFEYQSTAGISHVQCFLGAPVTEERSLKSGSLASSSEWKRFSIDLGVPIREFGWGQPGHFLRLDFGNNSGVTIQVRNIFLRGRNSAETAAVKAREEALARNKQMEEGLQAYLASRFDARISEVNVGPATITVKGQYAGNGAMAVCEVAPFEDITLITKFQNAIPVTNSPFSIEVGRYASRSGFKVDRALSKWVIVKTGNSTDQIISHARYATQIASVQQMVPQPLSGKKGLGGFSAARGFTQDLDGLGISSVTVNIAITEFMYAQPRTDAIAHVYGDKTYYFDKNRIEALDRTLQTTRDKQIVVAAIILIQKASQSADPEIGKLLQHPDYTDPAFFTMPNMTTPASFNGYAAALDFLASRYCRSDNLYGRIHHWIMHNEVDAGVEWTNMGEKPMVVFMDAYLKSMRLCYHIARKYDPHSEVFASFTHSWAQPASPKLYATKEMLKTLQDYSDTEGDFRWGLACHPYPQDLTEPKTWNDSKATFSMNSPLVTFKNLEVLDAWIKKPENRFGGTEKRTLWLSENGTNSRTYSDADLKDQAAGFAYAWKKLKTLDGIDGIQWHNWIDNRSEFGLRIGLRRFPDDETDPGGRKPVWYLYQAAGTAQEDAAFEPYKAIIGIQNWDEVRFTGPLW